MNDAEKLIADVAHKHRIERCSVSSPTESHQWGRCTGCDFESYTFPIKGINWDLLAQEILADHLGEEIVKALGGLGRQEQWVPVEESGHRWSPRSEPDARYVLEHFSATGDCHHPEESPVVRIDHEARWVSGWSEVQA